MGKYLEWFFERWWLSLILFLASTSLVLDFLTHTNLCLALIGISILYSFISSIYKFNRFKLLGGVLDVFVMLAGLIFLSCYAFTWMYGGFFHGHDSFADNLKIPDAIATENPKEFPSIDESSDSLQFQVKTHADFQLYKAGQPGQFVYDVWINKIESGTIYLKAYEITNESPLSEENLLGKSRITIENKTDSIKKFPNRDYFTIEEGDWGHPYAARFEVWFKPDNGSQQRKLMQKNYIIQGWQR